jgi:type IV pilus assembly protein PilF
MRSRHFVLAIAALVLLLTMVPACSGADKKKDQIQQDAQWHYEMAAGYFEANEIPLAIRELTFALERNPNHEQAHYLMGFIYMGRRNYPKSIQHFQEVLRLNPQYHFAKNNLGTVYLAMERWQDAEVLYLELLDEPLYTTPELAHNNLGWAYYNLRRYSDALEHLRMASFLKPELCLADNNMGLVYEAMGNRREAASMYRRAINKCPVNYQEPHFNLGKIMADDGDPRAFAHFERCVELAPGSLIADRCREYLRVR